MVLKRWALEAVVTGCPKFRTSGDECAEVTNITAHAHRGFFSLTAPLGKKFYFLSPLQRVDSLGCFENTGLFSQLGFMNNLESKGEDINKNQLNTLLGCRTEAIKSADYRLSLICEFTFGENKHWESKIVEIEGILFHALQMLSLIFQNVF